MSEKGCVQVSLAHRFSDAVQNRNERDWCIGYERTTLRSSPDLPWNDCNLIPITLPWTTSSWPHIAQNLSNRMINIVASARTADLDGPLAIIAPSGKILDYAPAGWDARIVTSLDPPENYSDSISASDAHHITELTERLTVSDFVSSLRTRIRSRYLPRLQDDSRPLFVRLLNCYAREKITLYGCRLAFPSAPIVVDIPMPDHAMRMFLARVGAITSSLWQKQHRRVLPAPTEISITEFSNTIDSIIAEKMLRLIPGNIF